MLHARFNFNCRQRTSAPAVFAAARLLTNCRPAVFADDSGSAKPQPGPADGAEPDPAADDSSEKFGEFIFGRY